jgi:NAD(P)-dependent dehydrogenase (short-subunit alcohol dehydrogenase family)
LKAKVYIASRWKVKVEEAMKDIEGKQQDAQLEFLEMDLSDLESVKRSAEDFLKRENKLHILVNNAGVSFPHLSHCG